MNDSSSSSGADPRDDWTTAEVIQAFQRWRPHLRRMVQARIDTRLQGRVDPSDVLQEAYLDVSQRTGEFVANHPVSVGLWLRGLVERRLIAVHRQHFTAKKRDVRREIPLDLAVASASAIALAELLEGRLTPPSTSLRRQERRALLQQALERLNLIDREILVLRHIDELGNNEVAEILELSKAATSNRYVRALVRLRRELAELSGNDTDFS